MGGGLIKQRVAREGAGKAGGYRTLIFFREADRAIFAYSFAKNARENLGAKELAALKKAAKHYLAFSQAQMDALADIETMIEVSDGHEDL